MNKIFFIRFSILVILIFELLSCSSLPNRSVSAEAQPPNRNRLWSVAKSECVDKSAPQADPPNCILTNSADGYLVFKDRKSPTHFLTIPTSPITGIEDPQMLLESTPNFFSKAWDSRQLIKDRAGKDLPDEAIGLALNPVFARSQDQLHVHMDCVKEEVMKILADHQDEMAPTWGNAVIKFDDLDFRVLFIQAENLNKINPVQMLKQDLGNHADQLGLHTLVVIGGHSKDGKNGFYIIDGTSDPNATKKVHGEDLLDLKCELAKK